jgi:hypothetical protein
MHFVPRNESLVPTVNGPSNLCLYMPTVVPVVAEEDIAHLGVVRAWREHVAVEVYGAVPWIKLPVLVRVVDDLEQRERVAVPHVGGMMTARLHRIDPLTPFFGYRLERGVANTGDGLPSLCRSGLPIPIPICSDRKLVPLGVAPEEDCEFGNGVLKGRPAVVPEIVDNEGPPGRGYREFVADAKKLVAGLRVDFLADGIRVVFEPSIDLSLQRVEVLFGACDLEPCPV